MTTYLLLNLVVLGIVLAVLKALGALHWSKAIGWTLLILLLLTAFFDSLIIVADIVAYDSQKILGFIVGYAPIEDFFYAILAVLMIPALWKKLETPHVR